MNAVDLPVALPWIAFGVLWFLFGMLAVTIHRLAQPWLNALDPEQRSRLLFGLTLLPLIAALLVSVLGFGPVIGGLVVDRHCHPWTGCSPHVPILQTDVRQAVALLLGLSAVTGAVVWILFGQFRGSVMFGHVLNAMAESTVQRVPAGSSTNWAPQFKVIDSDERFAFCSGLLRHRLLVSTELLSTLSSEQLDAVLAHEQAHARRYDNLRRLLAAIGLWSLPRVWSRGLAADLALATEIVCDREAAFRVGSAETVIDAISIMTWGQEPLVQSSGSTFSRSTFGTRAVNARMHALRDCLEKRLSSSILVGVALCALAAVVLPSTYAAHHIAESLLGWLN